MGHDYPTELADRAARRSCQTELLGGADKPNWGADLRGRGEIRLHILVENYGTLR
jgi:hypothetical protein